MANYQQALMYMPMELRRALERVPEKVQKTVQEIRLRLGAPLTLSVPSGELWVTVGGMVSEWEVGNPVVCSAEQIETCFQALCEYSVHTHQQEICRGFVTTRDGFRVGLGGQSVLQDGVITSMRSVTSLCIRVVRNHKGCARDLALQLTKGGHVSGALICGEPSSGKSSLLRDLAEQLSHGVNGKRYRVAVVDERGELSANGWLCGCDVLANCPKGKGIEQAVRCLAPDVILFDELGSSAEVEAIRDSLNCGAAVITTAHCYDVASLMKREFIAEVIENHVFDWVVLLEGRKAPGKIGRMLPCSQVASVSA